MIEKAKWQIIGLAGAGAVLAMIFVAPSATPQPAPSGIMGCVYNSSLPSLANLQTTTLQCDVNGQLILAP